MTSLDGMELYWRDKQPWLLSCGYELRPRFRPNWVPSWETKPVKHTGQLWQREDFIRHMTISPIMDAIRLHDNKAVMLKKIHSRNAKVTFEHQVAEFVSSTEQLQDPDNICVPVYEILKIPGDGRNVILVMPLLRAWHNPRFDTVGECLDLFLQIFKGLRYLHKNNIAHRDCTGFNLMMDGSEMSCLSKVRTQRPPKYYWIDFGLSIPFEKTDKCPRAEPVLAGDKSAPEYQHIRNARGPHEPIDPFPADVYYLGNMIRMYFTEGSQYRDLPRKPGFGFMELLVQAMTQSDPVKRPTIDQCVVQLEELIRSQSSWTLRSQVWHSSDHPLALIYRFLPHWSRRFVYLITRTPAIPSVSTPPNVHLALFSRLLLVVCVVVIWYRPEYLTGLLSLF